MNSDIILRWLEDHNAEWELSFKVDGEVIGKVTQYTLDDVLEASHKLDGLDITTATEEIEYAISEAQRDYL